MLSVLSLFRLSIYYRYYFLSLLISKTFLSSSINLRFEFSLSQLFCFILIILITHYHDRKDETIDDIKLPCSALGNESPNCGSLIIVFLIMTLSQVHYLPLRCCYGNRAAAVGSWFAVSGVRGCCYVAGYILPSICYFHR